MSLVVASVAGSDVYAAGDLRVSEHPKGRGYHVGALKMVAVTADLCVAFSGNVVAGLEGIRALYARQLNATDLDEVQEILTACRHPGTGDRPEFLVMTDEPSLGRIRDGALEEGLPNAWIGDRPAFAVYQGAAAQMPPEEAFVRLTTGVRAAIDDSTVDTVGETTVAVSTALEGGGFRYHDNLTIFSARQPGGPPGRWNTISFGTAQQGGFACSTMTPTQPGIGAIGLHFFQAGLGLLYFPRDLDEPKRYTGMMPKAFQDAVRRDYGFEISGPIVS